MRRIFIALAMGAFSGQALAADLARPVPPPPGASVAFVRPFSLGAASISAAMAATLSARPPFPLAD